MRQTPDHAVIKEFEEEHSPEMMGLLEGANMHYIPSEEMPEITFRNYFVSLINKKVVGFSGYKILSLREAKTELMVVDPQYRGYGIGYKLQIKRMEDMFDKGIKILTTNADIPEVIQWYKKNFGYREIGKLTKKYEFGDPNINQWTTLQVDLIHWNEKRKEN